MRFLADMGIALNVATSLRKQGHDVVHLVERRLERLQDSEIIKLAVAEDRIILTHDLDFGRLLSITQAARPSIVTFRLSNMTPSSVERSLTEVIRLLSSELLAGAAATVTDGAIRFHMLPITPRRSED